MPFLSDLRKESFALADNIKQARDKRSPRVEKRIRIPTERKMVFSYRDMMVTPAAVRHGNVFAATARIQDLNGMERSVRLPGEFANVEEAIRFAIAAGFEYIDCERRC
ncbi:hypothetical protein [Caballeronia hypogeia]|nr:hypothetical protein [Caballeronia hypogeia]